MNWDRLRQSLDRNFLLMAAAVTAVALLVAWALYNYGQERIIAPLTEWVWLLYNLLITTSQESLWTIILFVAVFNILLSLPYIRYRLPKRGDNDRLKGQVGGWLEMLQMAGQSGFFGEQLLAAVRNLLVREMTISDHNTSDAAWQRIRRGQLPLSNDARELLGYGQSFEPGQALRGPQRKQTTLAIMAEIAAYLESKSEVKDES
jgi:hypothetical protein